MMAAQEGHTKVVDCLLAAGANVNAARTDDGYTAVMVAAYAGHYQCLRALFKACGSMFKGRQSSALDLARLQNHTDCVHFLQQALKATQLLEDLNALIEAGNTAAAGRLISTDENVKLRVLKGKRTDFFVLFEGVLDIIEAHNKEQSEKAMAELLLEEEQDAAAKKKGGKASKKQQQKTVCSTALADSSSPPTSLQKEDMQLVDERERERESFVLVSDNLMRIRSTFFWEIIVGFFALIGKVFGSNNF